MPEPDEFTLVRDAMRRAQNGKGDDPNVKLLLENQRVLCAVLAHLVRGGRPPIETAKDLQARAQKITKILEGG